jgi:hypothetical protein
MNFYHHWPCSFKTLTTKPFLGIMTRDLASLSNSTNLGVFGLGKNLNCEIRAAIPNLV